MEAPLSAAADGASVGGGDDAPLLVPLPVAGLLEVTLPWTTALGRPSSTAAHRAALAVCLVANVAGAFWFASMISSLPNMGGVFAETLVGVTAFHCSTALSQHKTWEALYQQGAEPVFVGELLRSEVLPDTAKSLRRLKFATAKQAKAHIVLTHSVGTIVLFGGLALALHFWSQPLTTVQMLALGVYLAARPMAAAVDAVPLVLADALCCAMADRVRQITLSVREMTAATADYQRLIREIQKADEDIGRLAEYLRWVYAQQVLGGGVCGAGPCFIVGFGPRPPAGHPYTEHRLHLVFVVIGAALVLQAIWSLSHGAKITSACQDLGEAINKLRASRSKESGEVTVATSDQILQINNLRYFVRDFNRGQGMGFALKRKKITYTLVLDMVGLA
eukprot:COSAG02_NODE_13903_length_1332_cov_2.209246_1_plen_390_part_10